MDAEGVWVDLGDSGRGRLVGVIHRLNSVEAPVHAGGTGPAEDGRFPWHGVLHQGGVALAQRARGVEPPSGGTGLGEVGRGRPSLDAKKRGRWKGHGGARKHIGREQVRRPGAWWLGGPGCVAPGSGGWGPKTQ